MNLLLETKYKLKYHKDNLDSLQECLNSTNIKHLSKDARHYINDSITSSKRNIEYYEGIMKVLEGKE